MPLLSLPNEVIQRTAFWTGSLDYLLPPRDIVSIASTCRALHDIVLGTRDHPSYAVLANISQYRYSTSAPRRRLGPAAVVNVNLAMELMIRVPTLRRVRRRDISSPHLTADLWVVYYMCIEDDGHNMEQLDHAQAVLWASEIIDTVRPGLYVWPPETEKEHLAVAIYSFLAPRYPSWIDDEEHERVLLIIQYFAFAAQRYQMTYLMPTNINFPIIVPNPLWGHTVHTNFPAVAVSAALCFLDHWADIDGVYPYHNQLIPLNSQRFDADYCRLVLSYITVTSEEEHKVMFTWPGSETPQPYQPLIHPVGESTLSTSEVPILSADTDMKLSRCWYGEGRLWVPGMLTGRWAGNGNSSVLEWYITRCREFISRVFKFGEESTDGVFRPMVVDLREHVRTHIRAEARPLTPHHGSLDYAWIHEVVEEAGRVRIDETNYRLYIRDSNPQYDDRCYFTVTHNDNQRAPPHDYVGCNGYGVATELPPPGPMPVFPLYSDRHFSQESGFNLDFDGTHAASAVNHSPSFSSGNSLSVVSSGSSSKSSGVGSHANQLSTASEPQEDLAVDVVITGELVLEHRYHTPYNLFGRVRKNDGLVVLVHVPTTSGGPRCIFHGYVIGGYALVGRWHRAPAMDASSLKSEGTFILKKQVTLG